MWVHRLGQLVAFAMTFLLFSLLLLSIPALAGDGIWVWSE